jgi:hypothetical protein
MFLIFKLGDYSATFQVSTSLPNNWFCIYLIVQVMASAAKKSSKELVILLYVILLMVVFFSSAMFYVEQMGCKMVDGQWIRPDGTLR